MAGCDNKSGESDLPIPTLYEASVKFKGTWKTNDLAVGTPKTQMVISVKSNGEVPVKLTKVWLNRKYITDSSAYIETFDECKNKSGDW